MKRHLIFDTETTGLTGPSAMPLDQQPQIIEFAVVEIDSDAQAIIGEHSWLLDPGKTLTDEIIKITGLHDEDLKGKPTFPAVLPDITKLFLGAHGLVAHNLPFDMEMLVNELRRCGKEFAFPYPPQQLCTVQAFFYVKGRRMKMTELYEHVLGRPLAQKHRALDDTRALAEIVLKEGILE
jgi:DNA polymerase-3 subunit epsilon